MSDAFPPRPSGLGMAHALRFGSDPFGFLRDAREECGDIFSIAMPGDQPRVVTCDPEHIQTIANLPADAYRMADQAIPLNLGDASLLFLDGERHRSQHRLLMPPLHGDHLRSYVPAIEDATADAIARWPRGEPFELLGEMKQITLTAICACVLGVYRGERIDRLRAITTTWMEGPMTPLAFTLAMMLGAGRVRRFLDRQAERSPVGWPNPSPRRRWLPWRRVGDAKSELVAMLAADVAACREGAAADRTDMVAMLALARYEDGSPMSTSEVVDQLLTLLVGGYETTANALCWAVHHLLENPAALRQVREEAASADDPELTQRRPFLDACVKESLRLTPIAPVVNRLLTEPLKLGEYLIPAGTLLWPCAFLTHAHEGVWDEPAAFRPERFLGERRPRAHEWFPFGHGLRRCIGAAFAELEMRIVLTRVLDALDLEHAERSDPHPFLRGITISPRDGLRVVARPREAAMATPQIGRCVSMDQ